jgi:hypothetical protein
MRMAIRHDEPLPTYVRLPVQGHHCHESTTSGLPASRRWTMLVDHSHRADHRAASSSRTFLVRFVEGGVVECIEASLDRPGQGRAMDVG